MRTFNLQGFLRLNLRRVYFLFGSTVCCSCLQTINLQPNSSALNSEPVPGPQHPLEQTVCSSLGRLGSSLRVRSSCERSAWPVRGFLAEGLQWLLVRRARGMQTHQRRSASSEEVGSGQERFAALGFTASASSLVCQS